MLVTHNADFNRKLTAQEIEMLEALKDRPIVFDEDNPELTEEELKKFKRVSAERQAEMTKQTVTLSLSPQALQKAESLGKGYTSILSRILENALNDNELIKHYM